MTWAETDGISYVNKYGGTAADIGVGFTPAGVGADIYGALTGKTLIGGQELSGWERGLGLIPGVSEFAGTVRAVNKVDNIVNAGNITARASELGNIIPVAQQGRITMGVGLAEDANGAQRILIGTSEPRGYTRPGITLNPGETVVSGTGHAEADIVNFATQNGLKLLEVGATRPICPACADLISNSGAKALTPLKVPR